MFKKHVFALACCSALTLPAWAEQSCLIAGYENPASVCDSHHRTLASTCFNCHGPNGVSNAAIPALAGQDKAYLVTAMKEFRDGKREATVMKKYAMGYTDEEYEAMAALFASMQVKLAEHQGEKK
jgi:cytochrome c553